VAQAVVDQVVRLHHARVESSGGGGAVRDGVASVANWPNVQLHIKVK
jgi:hypothetical protein